MRYPKQPETFAALRKIHDATRSRADALHNALERMEAAGVKRVSTNKRRAVDGLKYLGQIVGDIHSEVARAEMEG